MGTDIHGPYIEQRNHTRDDGEAPHWGCIAEIQMSRNYELFALMAEVRRYSSFSRPSDKDLLNIMIAHSSGIVASIEEFKKLSEDEQKETVSKLDSFLDGLSDTQKQEIAKELQDTGITMGAAFVRSQGHAQRYWFVRSR
jgi:hypothetical protein